MKKIQDMKKIQETDLYMPVREHLERLGYAVRSEVKDCDITAVKEDELIIVELKTTFNLKLLAQAVKRQRAADSVYVAIPRPKGGKRTAAWRDMCGLLRRLELGLIIVSLTSGTKKDKPGIEVVMHPESFDRARSMQVGKRKRRSIIKEAEARYGEYNTGGSSKRKLMTVYRENSIHIACCFIKHGQLSPAQLKKLGTGPKTSSILGKNFYGWFQRISKGKYEILPAAHEFLHEFPEIVEHYMEEIEKVGLTLGKEEYQLQ